MDTLAAMGSLVGPWLDQVVTLTQAPPSWVLVTLHSVTAVAANRDFSRFWLASWIIGFLAAFGGGICSALLLQTPSKSPIAAFTRDEIALCFTLSWWLLNYCPVDWPSRLQRLLPFRLCGRAGQATLRSLTMIRRVDAAAALYPGIFAAPILVGIVAGTGGKLLTDGFIFLFSGACHRGPEIVYPGFPFRSASLMVLLQVGTVHWLRLLTERQGLGLVTVVLVLHAVASELLQRPLDWTAPFFKLFHLVTCIPAAPPVPGPPRKANGASRPRGGASAAAASAAAVVTPAALASPAKDSVAARVPNRRKTLTGKKD